MNTHSKLTKNIAGVAMATILLLMIPLVAMQFTDEVVWTLSDFVVAGILLFGTGFAYILVTQILATQKSDKLIYRIAVGFALFTGLFLIWVNLAVGIIGSENNDINQLYFGVIAVGIIGALLARFQPNGMLLTMLAMAFSQAFVTAIALIGGFYQTPPSTVFHIIGVNGFFITLFVSSAVIFWYAAQDQPQTNTTFK